MCRSRGNKVMRRRWPRSRLLLGAAGTALTATSTTAASATVVILGIFDFLVSRHAAKLKGHADVAGDVLLHCFKRALGIHKICGHFVLKKCVAGILKALDFRGTELNSGVLLVMKLLAFFVDGLILQLRRRIGEEALYCRLELDKFLVGGDLCTEFLCFGNDSGSFSK